MLSTPCCQPGPDGRDPPRGSVFSGVRVGGIQLPLSHLVLILVQGSSAFNSKCRGAAIFTAARKKVSPEREREMLQSEVNKLLQVALSTEADATALTPQTAHLGGRGWRMSGAHSFHGWPKWECVWGGFRAALSGLRARFSI